MEQLVEWLLLKLEMNNFFKKCAIHGVFPLFSSFQQFTENILFIKFCRWLDSICGPLVLEATDLPTEPQPLPKMNNFSSAIFIYCQQLY